MKFAPAPKTAIVAGRFLRPAMGLRFGGSLKELPLSGQTAWQSNGGPARGHPARAFPSTFEVPIPEDLGALCRVYLVGVFARWAGADHETAGTMGAAVHVLDRGDIVLRHPLVNGRHYSDAHVLSADCRLSGDGTSAEPVGVVECEGEDLRVDALTIDVPDGCHGTHLQFMDLGSPASFVLFDVLFEFRAPQGCPFHSSGGRVALEELGGIVRSGNRTRLMEALAQLEQGLSVAEDLDEARGQALTFVAVVTAGMLECGGARTLHRAQLDAARAFDAIDSLGDLANEVHRRVAEIVGPLMQGADGPSGHLVDRALAIVERQFATNLTDSGVAHQLGLSTSHFRFLFKQATGQPFHRYVVSVRLEKAREMLLQADLSVSEVAEAVGFAGLSHFSRAFAAKFRTSPSALRRRV